ncbi:hypothetical protein F0562_017239 [Nyssa sinensis]|uniref:Uncharacterized protein n=1 Tax=Nyssa sinensis TaxID=561372 RepID=A0A5J4ZE96_9ASTE|nr:hypothetical protein F0562_017239 [Nyssa sinensis]
MRYPSAFPASTRKSTPCFTKEGLKRGPWTPEEDVILASYIKREGEGQWRTLPKRAGLLRCGKSCRLRWMNYLRPSVKRGQIAPDEEDLILRLHRLLGNRWALIAGRIPGRTDNEIKNYWNSHLSKKLISQGIDPRTHKPMNPNPNSSGNIYPTNPNPNTSPNPNTINDSSENPKVTTLDQYQNPVVNNNGENWQNAVGMTMGSKSCHGNHSNEEYNIEFYNFDDTCFSFLNNYLFNEDIVFTNQQANIVLAAASPPQSVMYSLQTFNHGTIWEASLPSTMATFRR